MSNVKSLILKTLDIVPFGQIGNTATFFALRLEKPDWESWRPGQFVMLRPRSFGLEFPWARPLCICHVTKLHLICFFQVVGRGTARMAELKAGDEVMVWGPLGNGLAIEPTAPTLIIAGGMGIAPFVGYVNIHSKPWNLSMLFGHRFSINCYPIDSINERIGLDTFMGNEPADLEKFTLAVRNGMEEHAKLSGLVLACGPLPLLRVVQNFAKEFNVRTQLSLESKMACGVGACLGCVVKTTEDWPVKDKINWPVQACNHGPVFWSNQVELDA